MMTVMCPNCRHRFPAPGCCNLISSGISTPADQFTSCHVHSGGCGKYCGGGGYLVPRGYLSGGGCVINAPTIIHSPTFVQGQNVNDLRGQSEFRNPRGDQICDNQPMDTSCGVNRASCRHLGPNPRISSHCQIGTTCDMNRGGVAVTTSGIQSGGCIIQNGDLDVVLEPPRIEIQPNLLSDVRFAADPITVVDNRDPEKSRSVQIDNCHDEVIGNPGKIAEPNLQQGIFQNPHPMLFAPPSGCQELPGTRRNSSPRESNGDVIPGKTENQSTTNTFNFTLNQDNFSVMNADWSRTKGAPCNHQSTISVRSVVPSSSGVPSFDQNCSMSWSANPESASHARSNPVGNLNVPNLNLSSVGTSKFSKNFETFDESGAQTPGGAVIRVNATLQLPPNVAHCTVSITATANSLPSSSRSRNNFNGGGIVETDSFGNAGKVGDAEDASPMTPVSWVLPFPWGMNNTPGNNSTDIERLSAAQRVLQISGWYHEGLSWQQSASLLKNASVGSWLMRDSSDERFVYAVSVQTARGPTAVRVHYVCGRFRLDAEPRMTPLMPMFECPVKMIEHYIEYSKKMEEQKEVWVDHSGQLYSQINLTKPLLKEVRSLSHLARLTVNRHKISIEELPTPLKEYIAEYPYTQ